jgi:hypothetical protein
LESFRLVSVNNFTLVDDFEENLESLCEDTLLNINSALGEFDDSDKKLLIKYLIKTAKDTQLRVVPDIYDPFDNDVAPIPLFMNPKIIFIDELDYSINYIDLLYNATFFADAYRSVYNVFIRSLELMMHHILISNTQPPDKQPSIKNKIQTTLTVNELAYLFRALKICGFIEIPNRMKTEYCKLFSSTFRTTDQPDISSVSFCNTVYTPEPEDHGRMMAIFTILKKFAETEKDLPKPTKF